MIAYVILKNAIGLSEVGWSLTISSSDHKLTVTQFLTVIYVEMINLIHFIGMWCVWMDYNLPLQR